MALALLGLVCPAWFVWLTLVSNRQRVSSHCVLPAQGEGEGASGLFAWPTLLVAQGEVGGGGGSSACCAHDARLALVGFGGVLGVAC